MAANDGIIRTGSGRLSYLPDGVADVSSLSATSPSVDRTVTDNSRISSEAETKVVDGYLEHDGREAAEEPEKLNSAESGSDAFEEVNPGDREMLMQLASQLTRSNTANSRPPRQRSSGTQNASALERQETNISAIDLEDPVLDPDSPKFDLSKYLRKFMAQIHKDNIKLKQAGVALRNVNVRGSGSALNLQETVGSVFTTPLRPQEYLSFGRKQPKHILRDFNALMKSGEMLIVLGRPGSGCSTLLKTMCGEMHGLDLDKSSCVHYNGIPQKLMMKEFKGEVIYNQEVDKHFPHLTVGQTLHHAASLRTPQHRPMNLSRKFLVEHITKVMMAVFGLSHTYNTKVGDDFVRGVSGGERKRVSIAEMALAGSPIAAWDNSSRGLDSATALTFIKTLRMTSNVFGTAHAVAIYQASQAIYDAFDKAIVLYEGREIYFGPANKAQAYFENMGWHNPPRQTTGDFLTSVTNPSERQPKEGWEDKVPRTPEDFEAYWHRSQAYKDLIAELDEYENEFPVGNDSELAEMRDSKHERQAKHVRKGSPYVVSQWMQVKLNAERAYHRMINDKASTFTPIIGNIIMSLIVGSVFYNTPQNTSSFQSLGAVLFFAILLNALSAIAEINSLYAQRPIVEKHKSYAFYHPWTEALAGLVLDIPLKFIQATCFNIIIYFLAGLRREPGPFFLFFLVAYISIFVMSGVFRTLAASTKTIAQAMAFAGVLVLAIVVYTGFVIPTSYMHPWFGWIRWINPIFYAFEILVANEFHGRRYECSTLVPSYANAPGTSFICDARGAVAGQTTVSGSAYIMAAYGYTYAHVWRNFGILLAFLFGFLMLYFTATELNSSTSSAAEVLVFRRGHVPKYLQDANKKQAGDEEQEASEKRTEDAEGSGRVNEIPPQKDIFTWRDVVYTVPVKNGERRLLDNVAGWVKPGTLTALMGTSGAGKTTLLDALAQRISMGVITGGMLVNGKGLDSSFPRKTGYVQQQDLHLETATVRESLRFSAMLRQPRTVSKQEKYEYVESVIKMLGMEDFAEAVVGVPGSGLNVEQRKLLTIGVELAAKPKLLLFLDEPTSGLDSQSSWAICAFLRKLADSGQAILCTIHQPSAILFQTFDRLLFLKAGGKTVYFGDIGENSRTLLDYFEKNGARKCDDDENPAEYMLEIAADKEQDWHDTWKNSQEAKDVQSEIERIHKDQKNVPSHDDDPHAQAEFAMPFKTQLWQVTYRVFQQYWRMPSYILAKFALGIASGLFIGFSFFQANTSQQGMQNVLYSLFMVSSIFSTIVQQIMPLFVTQRSLYEVRERPSKSYSWKAFVCANIIVEWPYQIVVGILVFATFYYPVVGIQDSERQGLVLVLCIAFFIYAATFAHLCIAALPDAQTAGSVVTLLFSMTLIFNGVMQAPSALPGFWIFMYRVSPLTYWVGGMANAMLWGRPVNCARDELAIFDPPVGQTCENYMSSYLTTAAGTLLNPQATSSCEYCALSSANQFLSGANIKWSERWRDFGLLWVYVGFNVIAAVILYWYFRVRRTRASSKGLRGRLGSVFESFRNVYKAKGKLNKRNASVI